MHMQSMGLTTGLWALPNKSLLHKPFTVKKSIPVFLKQWVAVLKGISSLKTIAVPDSQVVFIEPT